LYTILPFGYKNGEKAHTLISILLT
jgi:hypothetical protein